MREYANKKWRRTRRCLPAGGGRHRRRRTSPTGRVRWSRKRAVQPGCSRMANEVALVLPQRDLPAILDLLRDGERPVGELVDHLHLSQPAVSKHLRVLKEAGLVEARADAQRRLYRIRPEPLAELDDWLASYRRLWTTHLDRLEEHLDRRRQT